MANVSEVEGIGPAFAAKLDSAGIDSTDALLERGSDAKGREEIAGTTGISEHLILRWVNHVDLFRVKGVAGEYAELLEAAGVDSVPELAQRNAENLHGALVATNEQKKLVRQVPALSQVTAWIAEAKALPRVVTH